MCAQLLARVAQAVPATHKCKTISYTSSCTVALLYFVHYTVTNVRVLCMPKILSTWPILTLTGVLMDSLHTYIVCGGTYSLTSYAAPLGGGAVNMHDRWQQRGLCMLLNHSLHMPTRYNGGCRPCMAAAAAVRSYHL